MARTNICGFETGDFSELSSFSGDVTIQSTVVRTGAYALRSKTSSPGQSAFAEMHLGYTATGLPNTANAFSGYIRVYVMFPALPASGDLAFVTLGSLNLRVTAAGTIAAYNTANSSLLATGTIAVASGTWVSVEIKAVAAGWAVRVNNSDDAPLAGTGNFTGALTMVVGIGWGQLSPPASELYIDDISVDDSDWCGPGEVKVLVPTGVGTGDAWTLGAGSTKTAAVSELPPDGDASYVTTSTNTSIQSFHVTDVASAAGGGIQGTIAAVKPLVLCSVSSTTLAWRGLTYSGSAGATITNWTTANNSATTAYYARVRVHPTDPADAAAWTTARLDAFQVGAQHAQSQSRALRMTWTGAMVESSGFSGPAGSAGALAATLAAATLAGVGTFTAAATSAGTLTSTLAAATVTAVATAAAPASPVGSLTTTLAGATLASTGTFVAAAASAGTLASTLAGATFSGSGTTAAPATSAGTLTATLAAATLAGVAVMAGPSAGALTVTLAAATLAGTATASAPATAAGSLTATLAASTLAGTATHAGPGAAAGVLAAALAPATFVGTAIHAGPVAASGTFAVTLGGATLAGTGTFLPPGTAAGSLAASLVPATLAGSGTFVAAAASAGSLAATLAGASLAAVGTAAIPGSASAVLAGALAGATLAAVGSHVGPGASAGTLAATLAGATLAATATHAGPAATTGTLAASLGGATLAGTGASTTPGSSAGILAATLTGSTLAATGTSTVPAASSGSLAASLDGATLAGAGTYTAVGDSSATLAADLADAVLTAAATRTVPGGSTGTLTSVLAGATLAATASHQPPGAAAGSLRITLVAAAFDGTAAAVTPAGVAGTLAAGLAPATLAGLATHVAPGTAAGTLGVVLAGAGLAATASATIVGESAGSLAATLAAASLSGSAIAVTPGASAGVLIATPAPAVLAGTAIHAGAGTTSGTLTTVLADATLAGTGTFLVAPGSSGVLSVTLAEAALAGVGVVVAAPVPATVLGVPPWFLFLLGSWRRRKAIPVLPPDHLSAFWDVLATDPGIAAGIGRPADDRWGWLWKPGKQTIPDDVPYPRVALHWVSGTVTPESGNTYTGTAEVQVAVWAAGEDAGRAEMQANDLGRRIAGALEGRGLRTKRAKITGLWCVNRNEVAELEEDPGPEGQYVYQRLLRFKLLISGMRPFRADDGSPPLPEAPDHLSAAWDVLATDPAVQAEFGRPADAAGGWLWRPGRRGIPDDVPYPRAALHWVAGTVRHQSGGQSAGSGEITVTAEAAGEDSGRAEARANDLGETIAGALEGRELRTPGAVTTGLWWSNADEPAELGEDPGPDGQPVYQRLMRFRVFTSEGRL